MGLADPQRRWTPRSGCVEVKDSTITVNYGDDGLTKGRYVPAEVAERLAEALRRIEREAGEKWIRDVARNALSSPADSQEQG